MSKKVILACTAGILGTAGIVYKFLSTINKGGKYLDGFIEKVERIEPDVKIEKEEDGYFSLTKKSNNPFKVLQITDLHIGGGYLSRHEDMQALSIMYRNIVATRPDLVVITGDIACPRAHISLSRNNLNSFKIVCDMLENIGIPYAITFGNHDAEGKATHKRRELALYLEGRRNSLLVTNDDSEMITGFSNYLVKLRNSDGSLNSVVFLLDSNEYLKVEQKKIYDYIHDDQVEWYEKETLRINDEEGRNVPSHIFFHIPLKEYEDAWKAAVNANGEAVYHYGSKNESISCSKKDSKLFDKVLELKSTKGLYCGHDHLNDFSITYKGVRFTYGQGIDCILYAKNLSEHKGATLLKIHADGSFEVKGKKHR